MRVHVIEDRCQGHTRCNAIVPEVFQLREDDGHSVVVIGEIPSELQRKVRRAVRACPERAISVDDTGEIEEVRE